METITSSGQGYAFDVQRLANGYDRRAKVERADFRPLELQEGLTLDYRRTVYFRAMDGTARECRVNGKVRTWKRDARRVEIPCKYGLRECATFAWNGRAFATSSGTILLVRMTDWTIDPPSTEGGAT